MLTNLKHIFTVRSKLTYCLKKRPTFAFMITLCVFTSYTVNAEPSLRIAVASNFSPVVNKLIPEFTKTTGIRVDVISGASGALFQQIRHGAPYDVFLSADSVRPANLKKENLIVPNSLYTYAIGKLAFWSAILPTNSQQPLSIILKDYTKIAISNPKTAPYGKSALEVLTHLGLENTFTQGNLITGMNVNQTFQQVRSKSVKGGFVALSQLTLNSLQGKEVPEEYYTPIKQQLVILKRSKMKDEATLFTQFLLHKKTQQKIASFGYTAIMPSKTKKLM